MQALTPRRWATVQAILHVATNSDQGATLADMAAACPPRLEYEPCYGDHGPSRGVIGLACDGDTHRLVRDATPVSIQADIDLLRHTGWLTLTAYASRTRTGGRGSLYTYTGPDETVASLMARFRWQPPRRPPRCPSDDDTYLDFYPNPANECIHG